MATPVTPREKGTSWTDDELKNLYFSRRESAKDCTFAEWAKKYYPNYSVGSMNLLYYRARDLVLREERTNSQADPQSAETPRGESTQAAPEVASEPTQTQSDSRETTAADQNGATTARTESPSRAIKRSRSPSANGVGEDPKRRATVPRTPQPQSLLPSPAPPSAPREVAVQQNTTNNTPSTTPAPTSNAPVVQPPRPLLPRPYPGPPPTGVPAQQNIVWMPPSTMPAPGPMPYPQPIPTTAPNPGATIHHVPADARSYPVMAPQNVPIQPMLEAQRAPSLHPALPPQPQRTEANSVLREKEPDHPSAIGDIRGEIHKMAGLMSCMIEDMRRMRKTMVQLDRKASEIEKDLLSKNRSK